MKFCGCVKMTVIKGGDRILLAGFKVNSSELLCLYKKPAVRH